MDELIKTLVIQSPSIAILLYALGIVYRDARADRAQAAIERAAMLVKLEEADIRLNAMAIALARVERACGADMLPPQSSPMTMPPR